MGKEKEFSEGLTEADNLNMKVFNIEALIRSNAFADRLKDKKITHWQSLQIHDAFVEHLIDIDIDLNKESLCNILVNTYVMAIDSELEESLGAFVNVFYKDKTSIGYVQF